MGIIYGIAVLFLILWLCGFFIHALAIVLGPFVHILLIVAIVLFILGFFRGRSTT